jgi:hypothetical protein
MCLIKDKPFPPIHLFCQFMHYNKDTHKLKAQKITGYEAIQLRGLCKHKICNSFHLTITDDEYYTFFFFF